MEPYLHYGDFSVEFNPEVEKTFQEAYGPDHWTRIKKSLIRPYVLHVYSPREEDHHLMCIHPNVDPDIPAFVSIP